MASGSQLRVFLAGRIAVEANGHVIDETRFPGRQGRLLFAYLVAEQGRPCRGASSRRRFGEDAAPATWEKALTVIASKVRAVLADSGLDATAALTGSHGCYRLELPEATWVDVIAAAVAARRAEEALSAGDPTKARKEATEAASLAEQPFLPGDDGSWVEARRRELGEVRVRALSVLADACLRSGDPAERGDLGRAGGRTGAVPGDGLPPPDGGARCWRQPSRGTPRVRAMPPAAGGRARRVSVAGNRGGLPRSARHPARPSTASAETANGRPPLAKGEARRPRRRRRVALLLAAVLVAAVSAAITRPGEPRRARGAPGSAEQPRPDRPPHAEGDTGRADHRRTRSRRRVGRLRLAHESRPARHRPRAHCGRRATAPSHGSIRRRAKRSSSEAGSRLVA